MKLKFLFFCRLFVAVVMIAWVSPWAAAGELSAADQAKVDRAVKRIADSIISAGVESLTTKGANLDEICLRAAKKIGTDSLSAMNEAGESAITAAFIASANDRLDSCFAITSEDEGLKKYSKMASCEIAKQVVRKKAPEWVRKIMAEANHIAIEGIKKDEEPDPKVTILKRDAYAGDPESQYFLALRYRDGNGVEKNVDEFRKLLMRSADQGFALAQSELGDLLIGVDNLRAKDYFEKAARDGCVVGYAGLANLAVNERDFLHAGAYAYAGMNFCNDVDSLGLSESQVALGRGMGTDFRKLWEVFSMKWPDSVDAFKREGMQIYLKLKPSRDKR